MRLIGIDASESGRDGAASDCYAEEARAFLDELLYGHEVMLMTDNTQGDVDKYGRLLRYVIIDEHLAEDIIISAGYAREYTYDKPYIHRDSHVAGERAPPDCRSRRLGPLLSTTPPPRERRGRGPLLQEQAKQVRDERASGKR